MAEGFYRARDNEDLPESLLSSIQAVCTIFTNRQLHYRLCTTEAEADEWSGLIMGPSGEDIYRWGLTQSGRTGFVGRGSGGLEAIYMN